MPLLREGAGKNRATCVGSWRKVALALAVLQGAVPGEKQARQKLAVSIGDSITLVRKLVTSENEGTAYAGPDAFQERDYPTVSRSCGTETPVQTPWKTRGVKCATASGSGSTGTPARTPRRLPVTRFASPGRIWALILCFFLEGSFLSGFGRVDNSQHWSVALVVLIGLST